MTRRLKQSGQFIQVMGPRERRSQAAQPCLQRLLHCLLDVKSEDFRREDLRILHATQGALVFVGHTKKTPGLLKVSHKGAFLP